MSPHRAINPRSLGRPWGYSHVVVPAQGRTIYVAGETGHGPDDSLPDGLVAEFEAACANVVVAMAEAGAEPDHLVSMQIFTTDLSAYLAASEEIGAAYRRHFGRHFGANALVEVKGLVGGARVELMCVAVIPDNGAKEGEER